MKSGGALFSDKVVAVHFVLSRGAARKNLSEGGQTYFTCINFQEWIHYQ